MNITITHNLARDKDDKKFYQVSRAVIGTTPFCWSCYGSLDEAAMGDGHWVPVEKQRRVHYGGDRTGPRPTPSVHLATQEAKRLAESEMRRKERSKSGYRFSKHEGGHEYVEVVTAAALCRFLVDKAGVDAGRMAALMHQLIAPDDEVPWVKIDDTPAPKPQSDTAKTNTRWGTW